MTLVVATLPPLEQLTRPSTRQHYQNPLADFCRREAIPFIDLLVGLQPFPPHEIFVWDPHFSPRRHQAVADILYQQTRQLLAGASPTPE